MANHVRPIVVIDKDRLWEGPRIPVRLASRVSTLPSPRPRPASFPAVHVHHIGSAWRRVTATRYADGPPSLRGCRGRWKAKRVLLPGSLSAQMRPPCSSIIAFATESPSPIPP